MLILLVFMAVLQADPVGATEGAQEITIIEINDAFREELAEAEALHLERREQLYAGLPEVLERIQKELTQEMKFDEALAVRSTLEKLRNRRSLAQKEVVFSELQSIPHMSIESLLKKTSDQISEIDKSMATASARIASSSLARLQKLLQVKSAEGDLNACLEIRDRMKYLRDNYNASVSVEVPLPEKLPTTDKELQQLKIEIEKNCQTKVSSHLNQLEERLEKLRINASQERRLVAVMIMRVTKERDLDEKVKILRSALDVLDAAESPVRDTLVEIEKEVQAKQDQLKQLDRSLEANRSEQLQRAIADWRIRDALAVYRIMQRSNPLGFPVRSDPEVALDLPELDDECVQIMDTFEAARQSEDRLYVDRLQPGIAELRRRLGKAHATLPADARQSREAITFCQTWLNSGVVDTLEECRLIPTCRDLPAEVQAEAFAEAAEILLNERHAFRRQSLSQLQQELEQRVASLAAAGEISACIAAFVHVEWLGRRFDPVPISIARVPWEAQAVTASALDAAGRQVLVRQADLKRAYWHNRRLVRTEGEPGSVLESSSGNDEWKTAARFLPGPAFMRYMDLMAGKRAFLLRNNSWELVTIREFNSNSATVFWPDEERPREEEIDWRRLYELQY
jgi:hypothetical protein